MRVKRRNLLRVTKDKKLWKAMVAKYPNGTWNIEEDIVSLMIDRS